MDVPRMIYVDISSLTKDIENKNVSCRKRIVRQHFYHKTFARAECVVVLAKFSYHLV